MNHLEPTPGFWPSLALLILMMSYLALKFRERRLVGRLKCRAVGHDIEAHHEEKRCGCPELIRECERCGFRETGVEHAMRCNR